MEVTGPQSCQSVFSLTSFAGSRAHQYTPGDGAVTSVGAQSAANNASVSNFYYRPSSCSDRLTLNKVKVSEAALEHL